MTDVFEDVTEDGSPTSTDETDTVTSLHTNTASGAFADASVRSNIPDNDELRNNSRYADPDSDSEADDVDPRALYRQPDINELRYYAREGPYGPTVIQKPLRDAFKHGFRVVGDNTDANDNEGEGKIRSLLDEYVPYYKRAKVAARRDGMAIVMHKVADSADSVADSIPSRDKQNGDATHEGFKVWTIDNLSPSLGAATVAKHTEYDHDQIYVSGGAENGGIAFVDDISHPDHDTIVGYGIEPRQESDDPHDVSFVHADRCHHFVHNPYVEGELGNNVTGKHVGESVLTPILQPLKATQMGYWAIKRILYQYSAPLYAVEPPESWGTDEWNDAEQNLDNVSMASDALLPPGSELSVASGESEFDPEAFFDVLVQAICAGTIFTQSVLEGTQSGTVSGSETDIKGYFSEVQNLRDQEIHEDFRAVVQKVASYDQSTVPRVAGINDFDVEFGPLFKASDIEQVEGMVSVTTAASNAVKNYLLTPDEAREVLEEQWAQLDADVDLAALDEDDLDKMDRVRMRLAGQGPNDDEPVSSTRGNPRMQNGGGQPAGESRDPSQPTRDSLDDDVIDAIADKVAQRLTDNE